MDLFSKNKSERLYILFMKVTKMEIIFRMQNKYG